MRLARSVTVLSVCAAMTTVWADTMRSDLPQRQELKRAELSTSPQMAVITTMIETGSTIMNLRDVPHAGYTVVGDQPLKVLTVHIVDKDKPLYEWVK